MLVRDHIIKDINSIESPRLLHQLYEYLQLVKKTDSSLQPNRDKVLKFAGILSKSDAKKITKSINDTFNQIEGEW